LLIVDWLLGTIAKSTIENQQRFNDQRSAIKIEIQAARQAGCWQSQRNSILSPACLQ
jgi:predicted metalloprotease